MVTGEDAEKFLQGQCTSDFKRLANKEWLLGAHCNVKGRMHSSFYAARINEDSIGLRIHRSIAEPALAALKKYIVFSKAQITIKPAYLIGLVLPANSKTLPDSTLQLPDTGQYSIQPELGSVLRLDESRAEIWAEDEQSLRNLWSKLPADSELGSDALWQQLNIAYGIAEVRADSFEKLIPQELNFQLLNGISFSKGCYTGQEIIARMHYRANLKKHLYRAQTTLTISDQEPVFGTRVLSTNLSNGGFVVSAVHISERYWELLVLIKDDLIDVNSAFLELNSQPKLSWLPLPYAIPLDSSEE